MKLKDEERERIRQQSKQVALYMKKPQRYNVRWDCPKCGNSHNWWWEDEWEAHDEGPLTMVCDRCMEPTECVGDGHGYYTPLPEKAPAPGTFGDRLDKLKARCDELDSKVNKISSDLHSAVNELAKRLAKLEHQPKKDPPSVLDLIHGEWEPFYERFRQGCGFTKETLDGETIAKMLRFVAVEVERMTERDMGGSFTISNLKVGEKLRELADEAAVEDFVAPEEAW